MVNLIFELIVDSAKLISKIYIYFCFNWIREMIHQSVLIVKSLFQILMTCLICERNEIKVEQKLGCNLLIAIFLDTPMGTTTLCITTSSITTLSIKGIFETRSINDIQQSDAQHNSTSAIMLSFIMLSFIMLSVIMLSVIMLCVIMLCVIMLSVIMLSVSIYLLLCWMRVLITLQCSRVANSNNIKIILYKLTLSSNFCNNAFSEFCILRVPIFIP